MIGSDRQQGMNFAALHRKPKLVPANVRGNRILKVLGEEGPLTLHQLVQREIAAGNPPGDGEIGVIVRRMLGRGLVAWFYFDGRMDYPRNDNSQGAKPKFWYVREARQ